MSKCLINIIDYSDIELNNIPTVIINKTFKVRDNLNTLNMLKILDNNYEMFENIIIDNNHGNEIVSEFLPPDPNFTLSNVLINKNILLKDKLNYLSKYRNNINDQLIVFRIISIQNKIHYKEINKYLKSKILNNLKINTKLPNRPIPPSRKEIPVGDFPGGYFSFRSTTANLFDENSILSLINNDNTNFNQTDINKITDIKETLREILLSILILFYTIYYNNNNNLGNIKNELELMVNSKSYVKYMKYFEELYTESILGDRTSYIFDVINDLIITCIRFIIYKISDTIKNIKLLTNKELIYNSIDITAIILKKFNNKAFTIGHKSLNPSDPKYNILEYGPNENMRTNDLNLIKHLFSFCILKLIRIILSNNYKQYKVNVFKYILSSVIYLINTNDKICNEIFQWFIRKINSNKRYNKFGMLLFLVYMKIQDYINIQDFNNKKYDDLIKNYHKSAKENEVYMNIYNSIPKNYTVS